MHILGLIRLYPDVFSGVQKRLFKGVEVDRRRRHLVAGHRGQRAKIDIGQGVDEFKPLGCLGRPDRMYVAVCRVPARRTRIGAHIEAAVRAGEGQVVRAILRVERERLGRGLDRVPKHVPRKIHLLALDAAALLRERLAQGFMVNGNAALFEQQLDTVLHARKRIGGK